MCWPFCPWWFFFFDVVNLDYFPLTLRWGWLLLKNCTLFKKKLNCIRIGKLYFWAIGLLLLLQTKQDHISFPSLPLSYDPTLIPCPAKPLGSPESFLQIGVHLVGNTLVHEVTNTHHMEHLFEMKGLPIRSLRVIPSTDPTYTDRSLKTLLSPSQWLRSLRA